MATHLHICNSTVYLFKARSAIIRLVRWLFCVAVQSQSHHAYLPIMYGTMEIV